MTWHVASLDPLSRIKTRIRSQGWFWESKLLKKGSIQRSELKVTKDKSTIGTVELEDKAAAFSGLIVGTAAWLIESSDARMLVLNEIIKVQRIIPHLEPCFCEVRQLRIDGELPNCTNGDPLLLDCF